jgi:hypothetical protein
MLVLVATKIARQTAVQHARTEDGGQRTNLNEQTRQTVAIRARTKAVACSWRTNHSVVAQQGLSVSVAHVCALVRVLPRGGVLGSAPVASQ